MPEVGRTEPAYGDRLVPDDPSNEVLEVTESRAGPPGNEGVLITAPPQLPKADASVKRQASTSRAWHSVGYSIPCCGGVRSTRIGTSEAGIRRAAGSA